MAHSLDKQNKTVCEMNTCNGCNACVEKCPVSAISIQHEMFTINAVINQDICMHCNICKRVCPNISKIEKREPSEWRRGWSNNPRIRSHGSSGGILSSLIDAFLKNGNYVCTCIFKNGEFKYILTNRMADLEEAQGSKYVKSDTNGVYAEIKVKLKNGNKVLFIGLPCQVAGLLNSIETEEKKYLYTVDMLCHGTPSKQLFNLFLKEQGVNGDCISSISFRDKNSFEINADKRYFAVKGTLDYYSIAFINGISYTDNCYNCTYACTDRISDVTVGDSWIEDEYCAELKNGISLIMVMTKKGAEILSLADATYIPDFKKDEVNVKPELSHATIPLGDLEQFRTDIVNGKSFSFAVIHSLPYKVFKQKVKGILLKLGVLRGVTYS